MPTQTSDLTSEQSGTGWVVLDAQERASVVNWLMLIERRTAKAVRFLLEAERLESDTESYSERVRLVVHNLSKASQEVSEVRQALIGEQRIRTLAVPAPAGIGVTHPEWAVRSAREREMVLRWLDASEGDLQKEIGYVERTTRFSADTLRDLRHLAWVLSLVDRVGRWVAGVRLALTGEQPLDLSSDGYEPPYDWGPQPGDAAYVWAADRWDDGQLRMPPDGYDGPGAAHVSEFAAEARARAEEAEADAAILEDVYSGIAYDLFMAEAQEFCDRREDW